MIGRQTIGPNATLAQGRQGGVSQKSSDSYPLESLVHGLGRAGQ